MGRLVRPFVATLALASTALIAHPQASQAIEPPPPLPAIASPSGSAPSPSGTAVVNLPKAAQPAGSTLIPMSPARSGSGTATQVGPSPIPAAAPGAAPATAAISSTREIVLELGKRQISLLENGRVMGSWPVAVGDPATPTPTGRFKVRNKVINPQYQSTKSGKNNPTIGPQGPLGDRWIGFHTTATDQFGIHGTPTAWEWTVKSRSAVSHGCVRMLTPHVRQLFDQVDVGTPVVVKP
ncbi:MAG: L,D-transpeptidase [Cyanobacteriota bacterium]|nr:L,D-transpeptidase [Cyanobacteriota bacterium]